MSSEAHPFSSTSAINPQARQGRMTTMNAMPASASRPVALHGHRTGPLSRFAAASAAALVVAGLAACGGDGGGGGADPVLPVSSTHFAAAKVTLEPAGANCSHGGSRIESGIDLNNNGTLDSAEVTGVQYACNGAPGTAGSNGANGSAGSTGQTSLVRIDPETAGANCAHGGARITTGLDANGNSVLDGGEVASTSFVCSGANGSNGSNGSNGTNGSNGLNSLMAIANEAAGANCAFGGKKVTSGLDSNGNNVLDGGEVTRTDYLCNGAPSPGLNWVNVTGTTQAMSSNTGYLANHTAQVALTLPLNPLAGDTVAVTGVGFGGWKIAQNAGQFITARSVANDLAAGRVWRTSGSSENWQAATSSADGNRLAVAAWTGQIHTSTDAGATWTARESARQWSGLASSADGSKLVAVVYGGQIHTSSDSGANWTARDSNRDWAAVASSADGSKLVAVAYNGQIHTSTDSGANWTARDSNRPWSSVASSSDGTKLVAATLGGQLYTSTDSGANWTARDANRNWRSVASSSDGSKLVAVANAGQIYTSSDSGANWTPRDSNRDWYTVASSADGSKLIAGVDGGQLYVSTDSGATWAARESSRFWRGVATSADGSRLLAFPSFGVIYTSASGRSTAGTSGFVSGSQYDALTLQYVGSGEWVAIDHALTGSLHME